MNAQPPNDSYPSQRSDDAIAGANAAADILIGRMVDHEASLDDRERFERLAQDDPQLWKSLAMRQQDMMALANRLDEQTRFADRIDLPAQRSAARWPWVVTLSGWAALVVVAVMWMATDHNESLLENPPQAQRVVAPAVVEMTADDYFAAYLKTGKETGQVINQMPPMWLETTDLPDGRMNIRYVRRIEENLVVEKGQTSDIVVEGKLSKDPSELRRQTSTNRPPSPPQ